MLKVAILYICTGKYDIFWRKFYKSSEKFFLSDTEKHYFVFTDSEKIKNNNKVHIIFQENLGWPYNTLYRFNFFSKIIDELSKFDYIFFFNANMIFQLPIGEEILPTNDENGLLGVQHPAFYNKNNIEFTYERNEFSTAFIKPGDGKYYFMGGFNGGKAKSYLDLIITLNENIQKDLSNNIIAIWHDESHLNAYFLDKCIKVLSPSYGYAQGWDLPFEKKIVVLDKSRFGGHDFLRSNTKSKSFQIINKIVDFFRRRKK